MLATGSFKTTMVSQNNVKNILVLCFEMKINVSINTASTFTYALTGYPRICPTAGPPIS